MDIDSMKCRNCGGTSLSHKNSDIMVCDYCGAEYDLAQLRARADALEKEQKAIDALAGDLSRLRQLADQKEAKRQKAIDEEKRRKEEEENLRQIKLRIEQDAQKAAEIENRKKTEEQQLQQKRGGLTCLFFIIIFCFMGSLFDSLCHSRIPAFGIYLIFILMFGGPFFVSILIFPSKKKNLSQNGPDESADK